MKQVELLKLLVKAGCVIKEGGNHTKIYKNDSLITTVPRHKEIDEFLARKILRDAGLK